MAKVIRIARVPVLVAGIVATILGLLWFDSPSPIFAQTDTTAPTVSSVAITSDTGDAEVYLDDDGVYGIGDKIEVTVTFSEHVTVTGSPQLELTVGSSAKNATYKSTTDSKVVFSYTVAVGDSDTDGISIGADKLSLNGGSIKDGADNDADRSHSAVSTQSGHKVDGIRPTIASVYLTGGSSNQDGVHTIDEYLSAEVRFSEHVYVGGYPGPRQKLNFEGTTRYADFLGAYPQCNEPICVSGFGARYGISLAFDYMIAKGDLDLDGVAIDANSLVLNGGSIRDGAGNDAVLTHSAIAEDSHSIVDGVPATVRSVAITSNPGSDNTYGVGDAIEINVTFSESVSVPRWIGSGGVVRMPRLKLTIGGQTKTAKTHERESITGTAVAFSYTVQDGDNDADGIYIGANALTLEYGGTIRDANGTCCPGGNNADLTHSAVAESTGHRVSTPTQPSKSGDATLSALTLSDVNFGTFSSDSISYTAQVANSVSETTVSPTVSHSGASYTIKLGGVEDADGVVSLVVGSNVITVEVTAEDDSTTGTYTVTVTRAEPPSTDASLSALTLSGVDFGAFASGTTSYSADVANSVTQTTVTPTVNYSDASYIIKLGGVTDADETVALAVGSNVITVEVTAEDDSATRTYTVTVTRISAPDLAVPFVYTSTNPFVYSPSFTLGVNVTNRGNGSSGSTTLHYYRSADSTITSGDTEVGTDAVGSLAASEISIEDIDLTAPSAPGTYYYGACVDAVADESDTTNNCSPGIAWVVPDVTSTDATLSGLSLTDVNFGTFASGTTSYTADVANSVTQTTITPTLNDSNASYVIKLGGVTDADGAIALAVGRNVITVEVTAEDDITTRTYTVTVTRAAASTDATLSGLTLSGVDFGTFAAGTTSYSAQVANSVPRTTVTPTVSHSGASYTIKLGGVEDADGVVSLVVGSNVITVEVTAEDDSTTGTYTVTVTRAEPPSTDASLSALTLSGVDFGAFASGTTSYSADVANSVTQTTVTPTVNYSDASYIIKLGGVTDADETVALAVGSNVITVEVTAEDDSATRTYTVTVTRISAPDLAVPFVYTSTNPFVYSPSFTLGVTVSNEGSGSSGSTTLRYYRSADSTITSGDTEVGTDAVGSLAASGSSRESIDLTAPSEPGTYYYGACVDAVSDESDATNNCSGSVAFTVPAETSTDATLSALTLSGIDFGTFDSTAISYSAQVSNSVAETTVTPTVNDSGASYVIKLGGVKDADGVVSLVVGSNVITIEVTAEDDSTTRTYTVTVTRSAPPSTDATLKALSLSGLNLGTFRAETTSYSVPVANSVTQTMVTPTVNDSGASYVIKLGGVEDADGVVSLVVGSNVITVEVTAEDDSAILTYTVTVARAEPPSTDATLSGLTLSSVDFGTFDSTATSYTGQVANSVTQTMVTPTVNHSGASYVIKLGGVTDADGVVSLVVGSNVITVEVTAEDDSAILTYTVTVARAEPPSTDATLSGLTLSSVDFGTFDSTATSYTGQVANSVTQTMVTPTVNHSGASYVIKLGGVTDADGVVSLVVGSNVITVEVTAEDDSAILTYTVTVARAEPTTPEQLSSDAALSALTLSRINFGRFDSTTTSYTAQVTNGVSQTTVTPTVNHSGASYVIKLGEVEDADGEISLAVGSNVITVEVTAEDDSATRTYTVTVTRDEPASTDASLSALTLSGVDFGAFASGTTSYTAQVAYSVSQTTVTPTVNDSGASSVIKLGGVTDADGTVSLAVGSNVITIEVTAEDDSTARTYTVTVTRAAASTDATLSGLTLSSVDFGAFAARTTSYSAQVANSVSQTTVTPTVNDSGATHVIKLGGVTDADGTVSLAVGSNVITVEVTAEGESTTRTYTVTVTRAEPPSTDASLSALTLSGVDFGTFASGTTSYTAQVDNDVSQTTVTPTVNDSGASYVIKRGGVTDADGTVSLAVGSNVITIEVTAEDESATRTYTITVTRAESPTPELSDDATLSTLTLSGVDFGTFDSTTTSYTAQVANGVTETTVVPTANDSGASYVIKLGGVTDADGVISLTVGSNVITIEVTAEDDSTTGIYTVTVTRAEPPSTDASLSALTLSGIDFGMFASETTSYTAQVDNGVTQTTVTPTASHSGASHVIKLDGVTDADGVVALSVGSNVITVEVTAEDESTTRTYTITVTRAEPPSTDATLSGLTLSGGIDFGTFASGTTSYTAQVGNDVPQTTVTPTVNDSEAAYAIKLGGVTDADGVIDLGVGSNVITIAVTAEDDSTTRTYTITVTRAEPPSTDATLSGLTLSGGIDFGTFASGTTSYTAQVGNDVPQTTVTPTVNDSEAAYAIKLGGVTDADGVIDLGVGSNVITIAVTAEDDSTTRTYTITVTRAEPPSTDATLSGLTLSGGIDFGTFASGTTSYTAQVGNDVPQTTVTPTVNDSEAAYAIKLGGVTDADGVIDLGVGSNVITIEVTAEDDSTTRTYTVTVTRLAPSTDAKLSGLTLIGVNFGTFTAGTTSYTAQVANSVSETTVTPTANHSEATYVIKLGGVTDADGTIPLSVGSNVITIAVTAEDDETTQTYTVTVTRAAPPSTDATLSALTLSRVDFGSFDSTTTAYTAQVVNTVTQTTVTPAVNDSGARSVIKLGGVTDSDGTVSLAVGSNVITVEVTAEDGNTTRTYTVTVTRAEPPSTDATLKSLSLSEISIGELRSVTDVYNVDVDNSVTQTTVTPTVNDSGANYKIKLGGVQDFDGVVALAVGSNTITIEVTAEDGITTRTYTVKVTRAAPTVLDPLSTDAALSALTLSGVDFGRFDSTTTSYAAQVANTVSQTTVTPTVNDSGASYVIKLGGVTDADGAIPLPEGSNVITVEVTAEDGNTTRTYTVTVTRAESASTDATLSALTLSSVDFGTFDSTTTSYTAQVANSVTQTTITPTVNDSGASYIIKLGGVEDADGVVVLRVGSNVITVEVTAEDDSTTRTYTVTVTRAAPASTDATLGALALSGVDFGTFDSTTVSYTTTVANDVSQTTVTPTVNHSGASYVIKLNGTIDSDGVIPLSVGSNTITIEVTAEDGNGSLVYTLEVTRSEPATPGTSGQRLEDRYDTTNNGRIDKNEVLEAINDYLFGEGDEAISKGDVIRLINLYLFG